MEKALKEGKYSSLCHFWNRAIARKRANSLGVVERTVSHDVKDFEWNDFIQAMLKLGLRYGEFNQPHIALQVFSLLHGAMVMSASFQRQSIMVACEALRQVDTSPKCQWDASSLILRADVQVLLEPLQGKTQFSKRRGEKRRFGSGTSDSYHYERYRSEFNPREQKGSGHIDLGGQSTSFDRASHHPAPRGRVGTCRYWARGQRCEHSPCRFSHSCSSCGSVRYHDPSSCPLMAVAGKVHRRT